MKTLSIVFFLAWVGINAVFFHVFGVIVSRPDLGDLSFHLARGMYGPVPDYPPLFAMLLGICGPSNVVLMYVLVSGAVLFLAVPDMTRAIAAQLYDARESEAAALLALIGSSAAEVILVDSIIPQGITLLLMLFAVFFVVRDLKRRGDHWETVMLLIVVLCLAALTHRVAVYPVGLLILFWMLCRLFPNGFLPGVFIFGLSLIGAFVSLGLLFNPRALFQILSKYVNPILIYLAWKGFPRGPLVFSVPCFPILFSIALILSTGPLEQDGRPLLMLFPFLAVLGGRGVSSCIQPEKARRWVKYLFWLFAFNFGLLMGGVVAMNIPQ